VSESVQKLTRPEAWVDRYGDDLFRFAWKRLQKHEVAEDVVQETFLEALRSIETYRAASSEKTWLTGILKHKIIDRIRKMSREHPGDDGNQAENLSEDFFDQNGNWAIRPRKWHGDPQKVLEQKHFWKTLTQCLADLPQRMAHAFALREIQEKEGDEISRIMGISENNLGVVLHRARLRLRRCLEVNWFS
jgi:RNA polymerase sigma-70 factor (ECF subfamily)